MTMTDRLVELARQSSLDRDSDHLRTRLLCNLSAALGRNQETAAIRTAMASDSGPGSASFQMAAAMHARTQDDFYPMGRVHVGTVVIPAVLAIGHGELLPSVAAGYEILTAVSEAYSEMAQRRGYRPTGIFGPIGAACAAGIAGGLDDADLASALALASTMAGGTNQSWIDGTDEWLVEVASATRAGVDAVRLASAGVRGAPRAFDGSAGWSAAFFDDDGAHALHAALDRRIRRTSAVAVKLYPISGIAQVPAHLAAELGNDTSRLLPERLQVHMNPRELAYPGTRNHGPFSGRADSLMSVARCVALSYLHGTVPYESLLQGPDEDEGALLDILELIADPELEETEVFLCAKIGREMNEKRGHGDEILYPVWQDMRGEAVKIARRSDAPEETVSKLAAAVDGKADVDSIRSLMGVAI